MNTNKNYYDAPMLPIHRKVFYTLGFGQITCSYALGIAGTALIAATDPLGLTSFWVGLIGAATLIGLAGSALVGRLSDSIGRAKLYNLNMVIFTVISLLQFFISSAPLLFILRLALGISIAIDYTVGSALLTEWLPENESPKHQSYLLIFWMIGFVASYIVGISFTEITDNTWKFIICSSAIPGVITMVYRLLAKVPESPSWLANNGKQAEAEQLIHQYVGNEYSITASSEVVEEVSWKELFGPKLRRNTLVGGLFYACQVFPFFGISIFLPILMDNMGITNPMASGMAYNFFMLVGTIAGIWLFNRISRRSFLVSTFYISGVALALMIVFSNASNALVLILFSIFALVLSAALVLENPYPPELFETKYRASGVGAAIAISRVGAAAGTFLLPITTEQFGVNFTLGLCCLFLFAGGIICQLWAPETSPNFT